jgi:hypothetical protein
MQGKTGFFRRALGVGALASALVLAGILIATGRTFFESDRILFPVSGRQVTIETGPGQWLIHIEKLDGYLPRKKWFTYPAQYQWLASDWRNHFLGLAGYRERAVDITAIHLMIPAFYPPVGFLILPGVWWILRWRDRRRKLEGHCVKCGYDLRAHRPGQRCPECGEGIVGIGNTN